ncbi:MAG: VanW family protein [Candidatus Gracilibacteria bacterium]|nr:VanW family protein [Candidatus Gracilibacteria bacterium]
MGFDAYQRFFTVVPEGTSFMGTDVSGLTREEVWSLVGRTVNTLEEQSVDLQVYLGDQKAGAETLLPNEFGIVFDVGTTVDQLMVQHPSLSPTLHGVALAEGREGLPPQRTVDEDLLSSVLDLVRSYERPVYNAQIYLSEETMQWKLQSHQMGYRLDKIEADRLLQSLRDVVIDGYQQREIVVHLSAVEPQVYSEDLDDIYEKDLQEVLYKSLFWMADGERVDFPLFDVPWLFSVNSEQQQLDVAEGVVRDWVAQWALTYDKKAGSAHVREPVMQGKGFLKSEMEGDLSVGRKLNQDRLVQDILTALFGDTEETEIILENELLSPHMIMDGVGELTLLSQGKSSYKMGNYVDRIFNVKKGLGLFAGEVIPPGGEFSFNQVLGYIFYEDGWRPALAIFGGGGVREVPGGGLCQVSTTMYRAAINAGLKITERKPHSLDVSYYHEYGYGIDATIFPPENLDLRFINDTPGPIVIHSYTDPDLEEAYFEFYGIDDGRIVELEQTINRQVILPRQEEYSNDLPAGTEEVLRNGRIGRYIEWDWTVRWPDGREDQRKIETLYPADAKQIRIGTGGVTAGILNGVGSYLYGNILGSFR